ncbi:MAG: glycosyl transferase family 1, partial [Planctomycetes bacterium RBG_16_64_10]
RELKDDQAAHVVAMNDVPEGYSYPAQVSFEVRQEEPSDYRLAADFSNIRGMDLLLVQHEYGIYGGADGAHILTMLRDVRMPIVTTMHTVLQDPSDHLRAVTDELVELSDRIVVMAQRAVDILTNVYAVPAEKLVIIPHGIPDVPFVDPSFYKDHFGVEGRKVLLTFGLLSPGKGIEYAIEALPEIVKHHPELIYIVLGATHPLIKKSRGEEYRHKLQHLAEDLGVLEHVMFQDRYVDLDELCEFLGAADIYITPYLGKEQIVSGTLAYAMGTGNAVIATPYSYAEELLAENRGRLVPFRDPQAIAREVLALLDDEGARHSMRKRAYLHTRDFVWRQVALSYLQVFRDVRRQPMLRRHAIGQPTSDATSVLHAVPELSLQHLRVLTDDVGILQHARYTVPDRNFGYCADDNARALMLALDAYQLTGSAETLRLAVVYLSFLQHAYNEETGRFRNFMSYDRRWLEQRGSEDSHARALWGLGHAVALAPNEGIRATALSLFERALNAVVDFESIRSWAFTLVGVHAYLRRYSGGSDARRIRENLAVRLFEKFQDNAKDDWIWPEDKVTYANGILPHALLLAGQWMQRGDLTEMGLRSLHWILAMQINPQGMLSPIGNDGWYQRGGERARFDQQPIEAHALLEACLQAYNVTRDRHWVVQARRCFNWFLGKNDVGKPLYDYATGGCRDGLQRDGINENEGAESTLAWLLSLLAIRSLERATLGIKVLEPAEVGSGVQ